jgi:hypothetical protein
VSLFWTGHLLKPLPADESTPGPVDLSKATKLKDAIFRCKSLDNGWLAMTLETITPEHRDLQQISIHTHFILSPEQQVKEAIRLWSDLDRALVQLWESHSIRVKVVYPRFPEWSVATTKVLLGRLFPEMTKRGIVNLAEEPSKSE